MKLSELIIDRKIGLPIYYGKFIREDLKKSWILDDYTILSMFSNKFEVRFLDSKEGRYYRLSTLYELTEICSVLEIDLPNTMLYEKTFLRKNK